MECFTLPTVFGNLGNAKEDFPPANIQTYNHYSKDSHGDNFLCTFLRASKTNISRSDENLVSVHSSDTCSSSDSAIDDGTLNSRRKDINNLNPVIDETSLIDSSRLHKPHKEKRSSKEETESTSTKHRKENVLKNQCIRLEKPIERGNENRISASNKIALQRNVVTSQQKRVSWNEMGSERILQVLPSARNVSCTTKIVASNDVTSRKRKTMEMRLARNKCLLQAMKEVIYAMHQNNREVALQGREASDYRCGDRIKMQRPIFQNEDVEKFLDRTMEAAVKKYKTQTDTWKTLRSENSRAKNKNLPFDKKDILTSKNDS